MINYILGIESSCDDTGVAIINSKKKILSNITISQVVEHSQYQGIVPEIAARTHLKNIDPIIRQALNEAKINIKDIDIFAATSGPGLIGSLIVGSMYARTLAHVMQKPFIAINHLEGHALTTRLTNNTQYPFLLLLMSGGHTQFIAIQNLGKYKILGQTLDDSIGETFDKVATMLKLNFPGGPEIEKIAKLGDKHKFVLPKPMFNKKNCDLSFSGLKTYIKVLVNKLSPLSENTINDIAASFQQTILEILIQKIQYAIQIYEESLFYKTKKHPQKTIVLAGGVASNSFLRVSIKETLRKINYKVIIPPKNLCTDNAAMIAYVGLERSKKRLFSPMDFCPRARWNLESI